MLKNLLALALLFISQPTIADSPTGHETYYCQDLKQDITSNLANNPEWKIRSSIYSWQDHNGDMPKLDISLLNFVYAQCEQLRNSARSVNDIVFDILDQAAYSNTTQLLTNHQE